MASTFAQLLTVLPADADREEVARLAWNAALSVSIAACAARQNSVGEQNPSRGRGSVSHVGQFAQGVLKACADSIESFAA